jgi:hypothetical protein
VRQEVHAVQGRERTFKEKVFFLSFLSNEQSVKMFDCEERKVTTYSLFMGNEETNFFHLLERYSLTHKLSHLPPTLQELAFILL